MPSQSDNNEVQYGATWTAKALAYHDLKVPSGSIVQVKPLGIPELIASGMMEHMDSLGILMDQEVISPVKRPQDHAKKKPTKAEQAAADEARNAKFTEDMMKDPAKLQQMLKMMDQITAVCVVQPAVVSSWVKDDKGNLVDLPASERKAGIIYTDSIDFMDKVEILGWAMGGLSLDELNAFHNQPGPSVGDVADEPVVPKPAKRAARSKAGSKG